MSSIPQLRRDINDMRAKIREAESERDAALARPPREAVKEVIKKVPERVEVVKEVPCPKQADRIKQLSAKLREAESARDDEAKEQADRIKQLSAKLREVEAARDAEAKEQAAQIKTLQSKLAIFAKYDMKEFERWRKMRAIAEGK